MTNFGSLKHYAAKRNPSGCINGYIDSELQTLALVTLRYIECGRTLTDFELETNRLSGAICAPGHQQRRRPVICYHGMI